MDWLSFTFGFFAFPLVGIVALAIFMLTRRLLARHASLTDLSPVQRGSTLSFSSRLIGEIGETLDDSASGPRAKAS